MIRALASPNRRQQGTPDLRLLTRKSPRGYLLPRGTNPIAMPGWGDPFDRLRHLATDEVVRTLTIDACRSGLVIRSEDNQTRAERRECAIRLDA